MGDQEMVDYLAHALQEPASPRPSIETLLHGFLPAEAVIHTHADAIVSLTNNDRAVVEDLFGRRRLGAVPAVGFRLSREVWAAIRARPEARAIVLEKHGLSTWGATLKDAYLATIDLVTRAEERLRDAARARRPFGPPTVATPDAETRKRVAREVAAVLRGMLGRDRRVVLRFDDADVLELVSAPRRPASPGGTVHARPPIYSKRPLFVPLADPASAAVIEATRAAVDGSYGTTRPTSRPTATAS
jgi:rhamnose utilization protein RhaD (predicted bifunctional aldolase and dehydrogenase)